VPDSRFCGRVHLSVLVVLLTLFVAAPAVRAGQPEAWNQLIPTELDTDTSFEVLDFALQEQYGEIRLEKGVLVFQRSSSPGAAVFQGQGTLKWQPTDEIESRQLERFCESPILETSFTRAVLWFSSDLRAEFQKSARKTLPNESLETDLLKSRTEFWERRGVDFRQRVMEARSNSEDGGFLAVEMDTRDKDWVLFIRDRMQPEELQLGRPVHRRIWTYEIWNSFSDKPLPYGFAPRAKDVVDIIHHDIQVKIDKDEYLTGQDTLGLKVLAGGVRVLPLALTKKLRVQRVVMLDGIELPFVQPALVDPRRDVGEGVSSGVSSDHFLVVFDSPLGRGQELQLRIEFAEEHEEGKIVETAGRGVFFVGNRWNWYPDYGEFNSRRATFDLHFTYPSRYSLVAIGRKLDEVKEDDWTVARWKMDHPVAVAGFNFGAFKTAEVKTHETTVTAYANENPDSTLEGIKHINGLPGSHVLLPPGLTNIRPGRLAQTVASEVAAALALFEQYFGDYPYSQLSVSQITGTFGQGWPSLLYVSGFNFLDSTQRHGLGMDIHAQRFFGKEMNAHETSHQWWGHAVGWASYRDQWLSEGFADYSGLLYLEQRYSQDEFLNALEADRERLFEGSAEGRKYVDLGPIWLGTRLNSAREPLGYQTLVYYKGAFILHMLRCMMSDFSKWDDSRFRVMMQDFVRTYAGRSPSTADFRTIVEKHMGEDMGWFFDQWVFGTQIPSYEGKWSSERTTGGYRLDLKVTQKDVSPDFQVIMPVKVVFEKGYAALKLRIQGAGSQGSLVLPKEPKDVEFNFYQGVLAR
jgi:hypothetical protein